MSGESPSPKPSAFASLSQFKPKTEPAISVEPSVTKEIQQDIDRVAEANGFHSREAAKPSPKRERFNSAAPKKQLNMKIPVEMHDRYYAMAKSRNCAHLWDLLGDALDALEREEKDTD